MAKDRDVVYFGWFLELEYLGGFHLDVYDVLGVDCEWFVGLCVGCGAFGRISKARDAFDLSYFRFSDGEMQFSVVILSGGLSHWHFFFARR